MHRLLLSTLILTFTACGGIPLDVYVAPSAEPKISDIFLATELLNDATGEQTFRVYAVNSAAAREDGVVIRRVERFKRKIVGHCKRTRNGTIVLILDKTTPTVIAHELGHAAGLEHHPDPNNFMYKDDNGGSEILPWQAEHMRTVATH